MAGVVLVLGSCWCAKRRVRCEKSDRGYGHCQGGDRRCHLLFLFAGHDVSRFWNLLRWLAPAETGTVPGISIYIILYPVYGGVNLLAQIFRPGTT